MATKTQTVDGSTSPTEAFFRDLEERGHEPLLQSESGTLRFDLDDRDRTQHWYVTVDHGDLSVSHKNTRADATVHVDRSFFDGIVSGQVNAIAAALRGVLGVKGDLGLIVSFQRLFPGPPRTRARSTAGPGGRSR